jgi:hypothetical protein
MYFSAITSVLVAVLLTCAGAQSTTTLVTGALGNATVVENNPPGPIYVATLPTEEFFNPNDPRGNVKGSVSATANPNGIGVSFQVTFSNLPTSGGPFRMPFPILLDVRANNTTVYHLHAFPVPADGNCTGTLGHVDPFIRGEVSTFESLIIKDAILTTPQTPACDSDLPQTCQVGDLAGKHGKITSDPFTSSYSDDFASTVEGLGSFFGNRSITLHFGNATRITCANFTLLGGSVGGSDNATASATSSSGPAQFTGLGAMSFSVSPMLYFVLVGAVALAL